MAARPDAWVLILLAACGGRAVVRKGTPDAGSGASSGSSDAGRVPGGDDSGAVSDSAIVTADAITTSVGDASRVQVLATVLGSQGCTQLAVQPPNVFFLSEMDSTFTARPEFFTVSTSGGSAVAPPPPGPFLSTSPVAIAESGRTASATIASLSQNAPGLVWNNEGADAGAVSPVALTLDSVNAYWSIADGGVRQARLDGSGAPILLASQTAPAASMAVDPGYVYWTNPAEGTVVRCAIGGCAQNPEPIATGQNHPNGIAADAHGVCWSNLGTQAAYDGSIACRRPGDGAPFYLATALWAPDLVVLDSTNVYWSSGDLSVRMAPR